MILGKRKITTQLAKTFGAIAIFYALTGQAHAEKIWEQQFTLTPDSPSYAARPDIEAEQQQMVLRFSSPVTGGATIPDDFSKDVFRYKKFEYANNYPGGFGAIFADTRSVIFSAGCPFYTGVPGQKQYCYWDHSPPHFYLDLINLDRPVDVRAAVWATAPEPSTWALMILGFGGIGAVLRRRASAGCVTARVSYSQ